MNLYRFTPAMIARAIEVMNDGFYAGQVRFETTRSKLLVRSREWRITGVLRTRDSKSPGARKSGTGRGTNALDWQGHYDFMEQLFKQLPTGRITTSLTGPVDYDGIASFYFTCGENKGRNMGSVAQPVTLGELVGNGR